MKENENRPFLPPFFANKGLAGINLGNILHHKSVKAMVPPYFKDHSVPIISYSYTSHTAHKILNYKRALQEFMTSKLHVRIVFATIHHSNIVPLATSLPVI
jgi:hypothetical protein